MVLLYVDYGAFTLSGWPFQTLLLYSRFPNLHNAVWNSQSYNPEYAAPARYQHTSGLGFSPFARRY